MIEVGLYGPILGTLKSISQGNRLGILGSNSLTHRKEAKYLKEKLYPDFIVKYPSTFEQWKQNYLKLQEQTDYIIIWSYSGIADWDKHAARDFVLKNAKVPSGTTQSFMMPYVLLGYTKVALEQGEWAMKAAIKILQGKSPNSIPITQNKQGKLLINDSMAQSLQINLPYQFVETADHISLYELTQ